MAETQLKRQREEECEIEGSKRHKSYNHILSLLEEDDEEPNQDLSSLITTLQQELSSPTVDCDYQEKSIFPFEDDTASSPSPASPSSSFSSDDFNLKEDEEIERERVMRHLLEASDDELGIPNSESVNDNGVVEFSLCDPFWEIEDEAANYYTLLQSELFM